MKNQENGCFLFCPQKTARTSFGWGSLSSAILGAGLEWRRSGGEQPHWPVRQQKVSRHPAQARGVTQAATARASTTLTQTCTCECWCWGWLSRVELKLLKGWRSPDTEALRVIQSRWCMRYRIPRRCLKYRINTGIVMERLIRSWPTLSLLIWICSGERCHLDCIWDDFLLLRRLFELEIRQNRRAAGLKSKFETWSEHDNL